MLKLILPALVVMLAIACGGDDTSSTSPASSPTTAAEEVTATATQPPAQPSPTTTREPREGSHLLIPKILVDAPVSVRPISPEGALPDTDDRHDIVLYDLSSLQLNGGDPREGNALMFGHLDAGSVPCHNGYVPPPCYAVLGSLELLSVNDDVIILWEGNEIVYKVVSFCWVAITDPFETFASNTPYQALTLMTLAGYLDEDRNVYSHQLVVRAISDPSSPELDCGTGSPEPLPTPTPRPDAPSHAVSIDSITSPASAGGEVVLAANTEPQAECFLDLNHQTGIRVLGFGAEANSSGVAEFRWRIPDHYPAGAYSVSVGCGAESDTIDLVLE